MYRSREENLFYLNETFASEPSNAVRVVIDAERRFFLRTESDWKQAETSKLFDILAKTTPRKQTRKFKSVG